jgi:phage tail-like protein
VTWWRRWRRRRAGGGRYRLLGDGRVLATCEQVTGLGRGSSVEHRAGTDPESASIRGGGPTRSTSLVLGRVHVADAELLAWARGTTAAGSPTRRDLRIELVDEAGRRSTGWTVHDGWVVKFEGPDLDAAANDVVIETLELTHEGVDADDDR